VEPKQSSGNVGIVLTAFEPSGDAHAAPVIAALRELEPRLEIFAWGGERMAEAGATLVERTVDDAAMGLGAARKAMDVRRNVKAIDRWMQGRRMLAHVAVDSPAANFPICKVTRKHGARIVHLVAPQMWAWGSWRLGKLRRLTDLVLCLLPFEEEWFNSRGIPARFVGHPRINRDLDEAAIQMEADSLPQGAPRMALFPGSRVQEVKANIRLMVAVYTELQGRFHGMGGVIAAANGDLAQMIRDRFTVFPTGLHLTTGRTDGCIAWCDLALAVSGTITLDLTRQEKPMIGVYRTSLPSWLGSKVLLRTPWCLLPNIIAQREIVPEFVPYAGGPMPIVHVASEYLRDSKKAAIQSAELRRVRQRYTNKKPALESARLILKLIREGHVGEAPPEEE